ncbi:maleylpyruvate isomerase family mycothiol-dependent enzyme [Longispora albida]|uniref:maleylpyruvate isomerase family mycothiol-dependent enzyme n=1 Tax=Longispora albida TaxID=203523 RepID=UPI00036152D2|nr:maleylpyruvate isomerase family mycothiol-dependent enzyme [Longispora albida]
MDYLAILRRELAAFGDCLGGDLSAPVEHCGDWTLHDLASHLGNGNTWVVTAIRERRNDYPVTPAPRDSIREWYESTCQELLTALESDPATEAWTFFPPHTAGFWRRRRSLETVVHRWDAEHALGRPGPIDPALAADGIAEVLEVMVPRLVDRGRAEPRKHAVRLVATDTGQSWVLGPDEPVAQLSGASEDLLLGLWGRRELTGQHFTWEGDTYVAQEVLTGPLVP